MLNKQRILSVRHGNPDILGGTKYTGQLVSLQVSDLGPENYGIYQDMNSTLMSVISSSLFSSSTGFTNNRYVEGNLDNLVTSSMLLTGTRSP